jgi:hypothetical protein
MDTLEDPSGRVQTLRAAVHDVIANLTAERDAALATAVREHAENDQLTAQCRQLRERVERQHETIIRLQRYQRPTATAAARGLVRAVATRAGWSR